MRPRAALASTALLAAVLALAGCAAPAPAAEPSASAGCDTPCSADEPVGGAADGVLAAHGLDGLDARALIDRLDALPVAERPADLLASVRPHEVLVSDDAGAEESVPLPDDEFYVSIAPYVSHTHDCFFHSLTTCRGELSDVELHVTVTDEGGAVVFDERVRTFDNGFAGVWLPRGIEGEITVESAEGSATAPLSTADDAPTCVTTLQLS